MRRISLLCICMLFAVNVSAQNKWDKDTDVFVDIDRIQIWSYPSKEELNNHFGDPIYDGYVEADIENYYLLEYEGVRLFIAEDGKLFGFELDSSKYPVMTLYGLGEGIRIGDSLEKFLSLPYPIHSSYELKGDEDSVKLYCFSLWKNNAVSDHITVFTVKDGIIVKIGSWPEDS